MFCKKCGNQIDDGVAFCKSCGTPVNGEASDSSNESTSGAKTDVTPANATVAAKKAPLNMKVLMPIIGAAAVILIVIILIVTAKPTVKLDKYVDVEFDGYETVGTARVVFDREAFLDDYGKKIKYTKAFQQSEEYRLEAAFGMRPSKSDSAEYLLQECVSYKLDKSSELTNGDTVVVEWDCDEDAAREYFGCKLKFSDLEFTVEGLANAKLVDPFENIDITYSGIAPNGEINPQYTGDISGLKFYVENNRCYSNGDKATVKVQYGYGAANEQSLINEGIILTALEKDFTIEGLDSYATKFDDISDSAMDSMKRQADDIFSSMVASNWDERWTAETPEYIGAYFLSPKTSDVWGDKNRVILVYKVVANMEYENGKKNYTAKVSYLYPVQFTDVMVLADGTVSVDTSKGTRPYDNFRREYDLGGWWNTSFYFYGYEDVDSLFSNCVTKYVENYNYESTVDDSKFEKIDEFGNE